MRRFFVETKRIVVVGAGPAGMMAAIRAGELTSDVTLIEKNSTLGKKLLLSGKGRCNVTNYCELDSFLERFSGNGQFLRDAFHKFFNRDLMRFFEDRGLKLKVERQLRVFPVTDSATSILEVFKKELQKHKVRIIRNTAVKDILAGDNRVQGVLLEGGKIVPADKIILSTGGVSFSFTGSNGFGINIARTLGHRIVPLRPGLVPVETRQKYPKLLEGLTLKNIAIKISDSKKEIVSPVGELMFTGFGVSGPLILSLSAKIGDWLEKSKNLYLEIDLKPGLSEEQLDNRLLREFKLSPKKNIQNTLKTLLPLRLTGLFIEILKIDPAQLVSYITQSQRHMIVSLCKGFRLDIKALRPIEEGMVTHGGVSLKDINPRTMESRIVKGLYFAGELIDEDADTGGFNLQAAFSTGYLAGESAAL
jgi:predicted Rossmann fold flavoprotein